MIARIWHGKVPSEKADAYHHYLIKTGLNDFASVNGNEGAFLFKKQEGEVTHFYTMSLWKDFAAIKEFAGKDVDKAKYYPEDKDFLLELEEKVEHLEVIEVVDKLKG